VDLSTTNPAGQTQPPPLPYIKIYTFGEFALERLLPSYTQQAHYYHMPCDLLAQRSSALTMLKVLICQPQRRIAKTALAEALWPGRSNNSKVIHTLDTAASLLRRHILSIPEYNVSLLYTQRMGKETIFKLPDQRWLWVDADELLALSSRALEAEARGEPVLPYLEAAHALAQGEFLEDEQGQLWLQARRQTINGARRRVLHHLVDIHLQEHHIRHAEELLFRYLQDCPTDEDALYRLMLLLNRQQRRQEALQIYHYTTNIMNEQRSEPTPATRELAHRIQYNYSIHEADMFYCVRARARASASTNVYYKTRQSEFRGVRETPDISEFGYKQSAILIIAIIA
jgi:DNA-binding SARP family transcriptional activator